MSQIALIGYGTLEFTKDSWASYSLHTPIGAVDVSVDAGVDLHAGIGTEIAGILDRITDMDRSARAYLLQHAPEDVAHAKTLCEPSLLFRVDAQPGSFTFFYSGEDPEDETCYGVEFREYSPFDLTIGD
jgi:hypothetical protein